MFGKFYGSQSYESFPTETNTHIFLSACLVESFPIGPERKHKLISFLHLYDQAFFYKLFNQFKSLMDTQAIGKANNNTVVFFI